MQNIYSIRIIKQYTQFVRNIETIKQVSSFIKAMLSKIYMCKAYKEIFFYETNIGLYNLQVNVLFMQITLSGNGNQIQSSR